MKTRTTANGNSTKANPNKTLHLTAVARCAPASGEFCRSLEIQHTTKCKTWQTTIKIGDAMDKSFNVIIERDEDGYYVATVPSLRGCHTQAKSLDKLMERTKEAIELCLEVEKEISQNEFIGVQRLAVSV